MTFRLQILKIVFLQSPLDLLDVTINEELDNSDHSIIQFTVPLRKKTTKKNVKVRKFRNADWMQFQSLLMSSLTDWQKVLNTNDVDAAWNYFLSCMMSALDTIAPYRSISVKNFISTSRVRTA